MRVRLSLRLLEAVSVICHLADEGAGSLAIAQQLSIDRQSIADRVSTHLATMPAAFANQRLGARSSWLPLSPLRRPRHDWHIPKRADQLFLTSY